jgi:hypothetical protein
MMTLLRKGTSKEMAITRVRRLDDIFALFPFYKKIVVLVFCWFYGVLLYSHHQLNQAIYTGNKSNLRGLQIFLAEEDADTNRILSLHGVESTNTLNNQAETLAPLEITDMDDLMAQREQILEAMPTKHHGQPPKLLVFDGEALIGQGVGNLMR